MLDRRTFVQSSIALAAALTGWRAVATASENRSVPASRATGNAPGAAVALVDLSLDGSGSFAARTRASGLEPFAFVNDVAGVWMRELEPRLRAGSVVIAGYTSAATLFCLDLLARDYGARIVEHRESGAAVTWLLSSSPMRRGALAPSNQTRRG
jgi:hypothetical protein